MPKTLLVPVDLNEQGFSDEAVRTALDIIDDDGHLHFLKVYAGYQMPIVGSFFPEGTRDRHFRETQAMLEAFAKELMSNSEITYSTEVVEGRASTEIIKKATEYEADAIVMASHKRNKLDALMVGSIALKVLNISPIPVTIVKSKTE